MRVRVRFLTVLASAIVVTSGSALAQPAGMPGGMGMGRQMVVKKVGEADMPSTEVRLKALDEQISFLKSTSQMRTDLAVRGLELRKLWLADEPDYDKIAAKSEEVTQLRMKMAQKRLEMQFALRKMMPKDWHGWDQMGMMYGGMMGGMGCGMGMMHGGMGSEMMMGGMGCPGGDCSR